MPVPIYLIDAFIDRPFSGNPAGVCLLEVEPASDWMQRVALEMNQSETAFVWPRGDGTYELRWFTPQVEVNLCGHATLAAAHALYREVGVDLAVIKFHSPGGLLTAALVDDEIQLDFPADQPKGREHPHNLHELVDTNVVWYGEGRNDVLIALKTASDVENFVPNYPLISGMTRRGLIITAPGEPGSGVDMVSRFFAPGIGVSEDPVTGSAHCLLTVYWAYLLGKNRLRARQASARGGFLSLELKGNRVLLGGKAMTMLKGEFHG